jgi:hypothetical protein
MDIRHNWVTSYNYSLPFGRGQKFLSGIPRPVNMILGGWNSSGVLTFRTGLPMTAGESPDTSNAGSLAPRPDAVKNAILPSGQRGPNLWFDTTAFVRQAPNTFGDAGNGTLREPGINDVDFSLQKRFPVGERRSLEFRAEAFNIFNKPQFTNIGHTLGNSNFGKATSAEAERELQLGLKLYF